MLCNEARERSDLEVVSFGMFELGWLAARVDAVWQLLIIYDSGEWGAPYNFSGIKIRDKVAIKSI